MSAQGIACPTPSLCRNAACPPSAAVSQSRSTPPTLPVTKTAPRSGATPGRRAALATAARRTEGPSQGERQRARGTARPPSDARDARARARAKGLGRAAAARDPRPPSLQPALSGRPGQLLEEQSEDRRRHRVAGPDVEGLAHGLAEGDGRDSFMLQHDRERDAESETSASMSEPLR